MTMDAAEIHGRVRVEKGQKRVRVLFAGEYVADSSRTLLVWEHPRYPYYYFPASDVRTDLLVPTGEQTRSPSRGPAQLHTLKVGNREARGATLWHITSKIDELADHLKFEWAAMDGWFEENEEVFVHPRDPYTRVDILQGDRSVRVEVDGVTVADTTQPRLLFETNLPVRYYLPKTDVRMDLLRPTDTHSECPYKGTAHYYDLVVDRTTYEDFVWWYPTTTIEAAKIAGYACFYNEKVDLYVDGRLRDRPDSPFK